MKIPTSLIAAVDGGCLVDLGSDHSTTPEKPLPKRLGVESGVISSGNEAERRVARSFLTCTQILHLFFLTHAAMASVQQLSAIKGSKVLMVDAGGVVCELRDIHIMFMTPTVGLQPVETKT